MFWWRCHVAVGRNPSCALKCRLVHVTCQCPGAPRSMARTMLDISSSFGVRAGESVIYHPAVSEEQKAGPGQDCLAGPHRAGTRQPGSLNNRERLSGSCPSQSWSDGT